MHAVARFEAAHPDWRRYQFQKGDTVTMRDGKVVRDDYTVELPDVKFTGSSKVVRADEEGALLANGATLPEVPTIQKEGSKWYIFITPQVIFSQTDIQDSINSKTLSNY